MGLETRRVSETRKVTEKPKTAEELRREQLKEKDSLRRMVTELKELAEKSNSDIDQTWVRENESKEFSFSTPSQRNDNNQMVQNAFAQMDGIGAFGKNARSSGMSTKELHELNESKAQSIVPQPEETILQTENTSSQPVEISSEIKNDDQPEAVSQEQNPLNNTTMLQELENSINERINYMLQTIDGLDNYVELAEEKEVIRSRIKQISSMPKDTLESLQQINNNIDYINKSILALKEKTQEMRETQNDLIRQYNNYTNFLSNRYGEYWVVKMTPEEESKLSNLYIGAYQVTKEEFKNKLNALKEHYYEELQVKKNKAIKEYNNYLEFVEKRYGTDWRINLPVEEENKFLQLYSQSHDISYEEAKKQFFEQKERIIHEKNNNNQIDKSQKETAVDNSALIEELSNKIDKKYNQLLSELSNTYASELINQEANNIRSDLQSLMNIKERSLEELKKVDSALNNLISRFDKLSQKTNEIKEIDGLSNQQEVKDETPKIQLEQQMFKGEYANIIDFNIRTGVEGLKQIKAILKTGTTKEQFDEFSYLYNALAQLYKYKPTNQEEEQQKLTQTYDITEKIEQLQNSLSNTSAKSR